MRYTQAIPASGKLQLNQHAKLFLLESIGAALSVKITLENFNERIFEADSQIRGLRIFAPHGYTNITIEGAPGAIVSWIGGNSDVQVNYMDGATVSVAGVVTVAGVTLTATNVGIAPPDTLTDVADVALAAGVATLIRAASANTQNEIIIKNLSANAEAIRIGSATITATRGHELQPGETLTIATKGAVYGFSASAQSVSLVINSKV